MDTLIKETPSAPTSLDELWRRTAGGHHPARREMLATLDALALALLELEETKVRLHRTTSELAESDQKHHDCIDKLHEARADSAQARKYLSALWALAGIPNPYWSEQ